MATFVSRAPNCCGRCSGQIIPEPHDESGRDDDRTFACLQCGERYYIGAPPMLDDTPRHYLNEAIHHAKRRRQPSHGHVRL